MKPYDRRVIGISATNRAELSCGHKGDYVVWSWIGKAMFCPICKLEDSAVCLPINLERAD